MYNTRSIYQDLLLRYPSYPGTRKHTYLTLGFTRPHEVLCGHEVRGGDSKCHTDKCSIG